MKKENLLTVIFSAVFATVGLFFFNSGNYHYAEWPPLSGDGRGDSG